MSVLKSIKKKQSKILKIPVIESMVGLIGLSQEKFNYISTIVNIR